jgi:hypothetical protein
MRSHIIQFFNFMKIVVGIKLFSGFQVYTSVCLMGFQLHNIVHIVEWKGNFQEYFLTFWPFFPVSPQSNKLMVDTQKKAQSSFEQIDTQTCETDTFASEIHTRVCKFVYYFCRDTLNFDNTHLNVILTSTSVTSRSTSVILMHTNVISTIIEWFSHAWVWFWDTRVW